MTGGKRRVVRERLLWVVPSVALVLSALTRMWASRGDETLGLDVWVADSLTKVFEDACPPTQPSSALALTAAANEYEAGQVVLRSMKDISRVAVRLTDLVQEHSGARIPSAVCKWERVGYVPVRANTPQTPLGALCRRAPARFPDPLLPGSPFSLRAGRTQPLWITFYVPPGTTPGRYGGLVLLQADELEAQVPVSLSVLPFELPVERHLWVTHWFSPGEVAKHHGIQTWSEEFWRLLPAYARNMAAHRQNVIMTPLNLVGITRRENGNLNFDYSRFDRWVETFRDAGVAGRIEGSHLGQRIGTWTSRKMAFKPLKVTDYAAGVFPPVPPIPQRDLLRAFLRSLQHHLKAKGWLDRFMLHIADEPTKYNVASWKQLSDFVHTAAPRLRRMEAVQTASLAGRLEVWVPQLDVLDLLFDRYDEARRAADSELWYYTCMYPRGEWANLFIDSPLVKARLLPWINYRFGLEGYLHWGFNYWSDRPFENVERAGLPPGDSFLVYPGVGEPLNSLRWEAYREGLEDFEYLWLLEHSVSEVARTLNASDLEYDTRVPEEAAQSIVDSLRHYDERPEALLAARARVAAALTKLWQRPLLLARVRRYDPELQHPGTPTPMRQFQLLAATEPGTTVAVNGKRVAVSASGRFGGVASVPEGQVGIEVRLERNGSSKEVVCTPGGIL